MSGDAHRRLGARPYGPHKPVCKGVALRAALAAQSWIDAPLTSEYRTSNGGLKLCSARTHLVLAKADTTGNLARTSTSSIKKARHSREAPSAVHNVGQK